MRIEPPKSLDDIKSGTFPEWVFDKCDSCLYLFGAGFYGANDAIHSVAYKSERVTVVDTDEEKLNRMRFVYPEHWDFENMDAYTFARTTDEMWDLVVVDPPIFQNQKTVDLLWLWCNLSDKYVVITILPDVLEKNNLAVGTVISDNLSEPRMITKFMKRNQKSTYWMVIE